MLPLPLAPGPREKGWEAQTYTLPAHPLFPRGATPRAPLPALSLCAPGVSALSEARGTVFPARIDRAASPRALCPAPPPV